MTATPAPAWRPVLREGRPVAVLLDLAPAGRAAMVWASARPGTANVLVLGSLVDAAAVAVAAPPLPDLMAPRWWAVVRHADPSGVSGTGLVAIAAEVRPLGAVVLAWTGKTTGVQSVTAYRSVGELRRIHGHAGATSLVTWSASPQPSTGGVALRLPPSHDDGYLTSNDVVPSPTLVPAGPVRPRLPHAAAAVSAGTGALDQASGGEPR